MTGAGNDFFQTRSPALTLNAMAWAAVHELSDDDDPVTVAAPKESSGHQKVAGARTAASVAKSPKKSVGDGLTPAELFAAEKAKRADPKGKSAKAKASKAKAKPKVKPSKGAGSDSAELPVLKRPAGRSASADDATEGPPDVVDGGDGGDDNEPPLVMRRPSALRRPSAAPQGESALKIPKLCKYLYRKKHMWGIKRDGREVLTVIHLVSQHAALQLCCVFCFFELAFNIAR